ncbi:MAG: hypothetical protein CYG60_26020 [Actinobacteria bacterium]|nr:MAG: hypothetical protein CYG60_26020 [Actinomycetota bacterium]
MPLPENRNKPADRSTRHHVVDSRFAAILTQDFGIETVVILDALEGEPQKAAIKILAWAERTGDPARALVAWARKHNKGRCRRAARPADRPQRRHGSPGGNRPGDGRGSGPARTGGIDPAFVRANLEKMEG